MKSSAERFLSTLIFDFVIFRPPLLESPLDLDQTEYVVIQSTCDSSRDDMILESPDIHYRAGALGTNLRENAKTAFLNRGPFSKFMLGGRS